MRALLFLLIGSPALAAEAPDLGRWAREDVGSFLGGLPAAAAALGSGAPTGPLDLPLSPPLPLPMGGSSPLTSWMERSAAATTRRLFAGVSELGRADVPVEPVPIEGDVVGLGLPPDEAAERWRPNVVPERGPQAFKGSKPKPLFHKPRLRGTDFRVERIKPSPVRSLRER